MNMYLVLSFNNAINTPSCQFCLTTTYNTFREFYFKYYVIESNSLIAFFPLNAFKILFSKIIKPKKVFLEVPAKSNCKTQNSIYSRKR